MKARTAGSMLRVVVKTNWTVPSGVLHWGSTWTDTTPIEQFKAISCLLYQCSDGNVPNSPLYYELSHAAGELAQRIVQDLPEYDKASWGDYARRAVRHRFKRRPDEWAETIGEWRDRTASLPRHTPAGRRIAICPATYSGATCKTCGACARVRDAVIGFPAHGAWRRVEAAIAARDVPAGESWTFQDHRTMAEVVAKETAAA
jgi:hypothetical protein